jgi:hypothetical protein
MSNHFPKVKTVTPLAGKRLLVGFDNDIAKVYDCTPLLEREAFKPLQNETLFRQVHADPHGYAVIWNDDIDLAEAELWLRGVPAAERQSA